MARKDPLRNFRFRLEIDGIAQAGFSECTGGESTVAAVDYREGTDPMHVRKLTGLVAYTNVTLKWGVTDSTDLYQWFKDTRDGTVVRKTVNIVVQDESGADRAAFEILEAWPSKYDFSDLNAKGNEAFIETLELANEGINRIR
jgi:phage tail-like protein